MLSFATDHRSRTAMDRLLEPYSIAIIGASANPEKRGYQILQSLLDNGYQYPIYPVNPKGGSILGIEVVRNISQLPPGIDMTVVARPAEEVPRIIWECGQIGIGGAVILANGFKEAGAKGQELENVLVEEILKTDTRVIGPNTSGIINFKIGADLVGLKEKPSHGPISVITQSGNMLLSLAADCETYSAPGFDVYVGLGNQVDVSYADLLVELGKRPSTNTIALHCEGLRDGRLFMAAAASVARHCAIALLRGGRSEEGRKTALSHTGAVAGSDQVTSRLLPQVGITLVERSDELAMVSGVLATLPLPKAGTGVTVISDGGGHATLAADALAAAGIRLSRLAPNTLARLRQNLGETAAVDNPIDVASAIDATPAEFASCVDILVQDPDVGLILIVGLFGGYHLRFDASQRESESEAAQRLSATALTSGCPIILHSCYEHRHPPAHTILRRHKIPVLGSIEHSVTCARALIERSRWLATVDQRISPDALRSAYRTMDATHFSVTLAEMQAREIVETAGVDTGAWAIAHDVSEIKSLVTSLGGNCALKIVSKDITHKSDIGGVQLNVNSQESEKAFQSILNNVQDAMPSAEIVGVMVTPMMEGGTELLIGITVDRIYGPVIAFGAGGLTVEAIKDVSFRALPLTQAEASEMIMETAVSRILFGYRKLPATDLDDLVRFVVDVGNAALRIPNLVDLEFNPVILNDQGLNIADIGLVVSID